MNVSLLSSLVNCSQQADRITHDFLTNSADSGDFPGRHDLARGALRRLVYSSAGFRVRRAAKDYLLRLAPQRPKTLTEYVRAGVEFVMPHLSLPEHTVFDRHTNDTHRAVNDALIPGGKKLRPILSFMAADVYGIPWSAVLPLAVANEYVQTASLIFDDLPAQDNATLRRGRFATHIAFGEATAQLGGIVLFAKSAQLLAELPIDLRVMRDIEIYMAQMLDGLCQGQSLDLKLTSRHEIQTYLEEILYLKASLTIESSLVPVAMMAGALGDIRAWKDYAYHFGIAYQIRDDIMDVEGGGEALGKSTGMDAANGKATLVAVLGLDGAKRLMMEHYHHALESLERIQGDTRLLREILEFAIIRRH